MTDTHAPITEPHLTPMFDSGVLPSQAPNTEPHPAPIFDTGPHPGPLRAAGAADAEPVEVEPVEVEVQVEPVEVGAGQVDAEVEPVDAEPASAPEAAPRPELEPELEPHPSAPQAFSELDNVDTDAFLRSVTGHFQSAPGVVLPALPVAVPSSYQFVKRWKFALIVAGVWLVAASAGLGFYYWWYSSLTKTLPVFGILLYMVACMVAAILVSMIANRPQVSALALALMAAPLASTAAAAVLHGAYYFEWIARPVIG